MFINRQIGDHHLASSSPCIDAGDDAVVVSSWLDIDSEPRILKNHVDIGDDEYSGLESTIDDLKGMDNPSTYVKVNNLVVSSVFSGFYYVEDQNRSCGMRVAQTRGSLPGLNSVVVVRGYPATSSNGERSITATDVSVIETGSVTPLLMSNRSLGGSQFGLQEGITGSFGLNNIGLLIKTTGKVSSFGLGYFYINDGSAGNGELGIKVYGTVPVAQGQDPTGKFVAVTGISSCDRLNNQLVSVIRTSKTGDVEILD